MNHDVVIAGGGPAGLNAALLLGRSRKRVLLCDSGVPRNAAAAGVHNFVTRDGISPAEFRRAARADLVAYPNVETRETALVDVVREGDLLRATFADGATSLTRRVLLATGLVDVLPDIEGLRAIWGTHAYVCPYCHGWEVRDRAWVVLLDQDAWAPWALILLGWTRNLVAVTNGATLAAESLATLGNAGVRVVHEKIARVAAGSLDLASGERLPCDAFFVRPAQEPTPIVKRLGLALDATGFVTVDDKKESSMLGVHVAGDASSMAQAAIVAASTGAMAASMINHALTMEDVRTARPATA